MLATPKQLTNFVLPNKKSKSSYDIFFLITFPRGKDMQWMVGTNTKGHLPLNKGGCFFLPRITLGEGLSLRTNPWYYYGKDHSLGLEKEDGKRTRHAHLLQIEAM